MNFEPTDAQREVQRRAREVASELIAPQAAELDVTERFPVDTFRELGKRGMLGLSAPAAYGGSRSRGPFVSRSQGADLMPRRCGRQRNAMVTVTS
jgi:alkylation response protein AidB-like acyl-CoA dehydrogenase